jgi:putative spermidine/putrescine transport system permease protein
VDAVRRRISPVTAAVALGGLAFFALPLAATLEFSLRTAHSHGFAAYRELLADGQFWSTLTLSLRLAGETIAVALGLLVPTAYWVHRHAVRLRPLVTFACVLPFVVPPIVLVVGLLGVFRGQTWFVSTPQFLVPGYVVLSLPYVWFSLDAGLRAIDVRTLSEAAESLGAGQLRTLAQVILPGLRAAILAGALLTLAIVLGEFTMASLSLFNTFPVYVAYVGQTRATGAAALTIVSLGMLWAAMLALALATRGRRAARVA